MFRYLWWVTALMLCITVSSLWAQAVGVPPVAYNDASTIFQSVHKALGALKTGDMLALLMVFVNLMTQLLKMKWFQNALGKIIPVFKSWRLKPQGKIFLAMFLALGVVALICPALTWYRTLGKAVVVAFAAMGFRDFWVYVVKGDTHRAKAHRE